MQYLFFLYELDAECSRATFSSGAPCGAPCGAPAGHRRGTVNFPNAAQVALEMGGLEPRATLCIVSGSLQAQWRQAVVSQRAMPEEETGLQERVQGT